MKEAAGEANMTVVTIVLIAVVLGVGTLIVNNLMTSSSKKAACSEAGGMWVNNSCGFDCVGDDAGGYVCAKTLGCVRIGSEWSCVSN